MKGEHELGRSRRRRRRRRIPGYCLNETTR